MGTTPRGLRYPEPTDLVTNGATAMQALAEDTDAEFDTLGSTVAAKVRKLTDQSLLNTTLTTITWDTEDDDTDALHDNVTNNSRLTVPSDGAYLVLANLIFGNNATGDRVVGIYRNGTELIGQAQHGAAGSFPTVVHCSTYDRAEAGDYYTVTGYQNSGGALDVDAGSTCWFSVVRLGD